MLRYVYLICTDQILFPIFFLEHNMAHDKLQLTITFISTITCKSSMQVRSAVCQYFPTWPVNQEKIDCFWFPFPCLSVKVDHHLMLCVLLFNTPLISRWWSKLWGVIFLKLKNILCYNLCWIPLLLISTTFTEQLHLFSDWG